MLQDFILPVIDKNSEGMFKFTIIFRGDFNDTRFYFTCY
jgi:hypothetical protein